MKTDINTLASLIASMVWCDGEYSELERACVADIAEALGINTEELSDKVKAAADELNDLDDDAVTAFMCKHAAKVAEEDLGVVFEAMMEIALCDGVLTVDEVGNLMEAADALNIERNDAILLLCDMVKIEPDLELAF